MLNFDSVTDVYQNMFSPSFIFSSLKNQKALDKILIQKSNMVNPKKIVIGTRLQQKKRKIRNRVVDRICKVTDDAYIVPFLDNTATQKKKIF